MSIFTTTDFVLMPADPLGVLAYRADIANLMPEVRALHLDGQRILVVPHRPTEAKLLRSLGLDVPSPILHRYDWAKTTPFEAQKLTAAVLTEEPAVYVLSEFGTGKTRSALFAFDYLHKNGLAKEMLVVAPLSTLRTTWEAEIRSVFPHLHSIVVYGERAVREKILDEGGFDVYIINHDAVRMLTGKLMARQFDVVCVDELTAFKNATADRSKAMRRIAADAHYRWGMTGSPTPQGPEDAHGQIKLITPQNGASSAARWRDRVMTRVSQFKWVPKADAKERVHEAMQPSVRFLRSDIVELPPLSIIPREVEMSPLQASTYNEVMRHLYAEVAAGEVTAANEAVKLTKLLQISSGFVYTTNSFAQFLDPEPRLDAIEEVIEEAQAKVLVFSPFIAGVDLLHERLSKNHAFGKVNGQVSSTRRSEIFSAFQDGDLFGIVAHPQTMAHGLNLHAADMIVWAAPYPSLEIYEQANARITRPGQTRKQMIVQITGSPVEAKVYKRLDMRATMQNALLEMF